MNNIVRSGFLISIVFASWVAVADSRNSHEYKPGAFTVKKNMRIKDAINGLFYEQQESSEKCRAQKS